MVLLGEVEQLSRPAQNIPGFWSPIVEAAIITKITFHVPMAYGTDSGPYIDPTFYLVSPFWILATSDTMTVSSKLKTSVFTLSCLISPRRFHWSAAPHCYAAVCGVRAVVSTFQTGCRFKRLFCCAASLTPSGVCAAMR